MPTVCAVFGCRNLTTDKRHRFFSVPGIRRREGEAAEELSRKRRHLWIKALNRKGISSSTVRVHHVICSDHFISGKPAYLHDRANPDWVPTKNMGYGKEFEKAQASFGRIVTRKKLKTKDLATTSTLLEADSDMGDLQESEPETSFTEEASNEVPSKDGAPLVSEAAMSSLQEITDQYTSQLYDVIKREVIDNEYLEHDTSDSGQNEKKPVVNVVGCDNSAIGTLRTGHLDYPNSGIILEHEVKKEVEDEEQWKPEQCQQKPVVDDDDTIHSTTKRNPTESTDPEVVTKVKTEECCSCSQCYSWACSLDSASNSAATDHKTTLYQTAGMDGTDSMDKPVGDVTNVCEMPANSSSQKDPSNVKSSEKQGELQSCYFQTDGCCTESELNASHKNNKKSLVRMMLMQYDVCEATFSTNYLENDKGKDSGEKPYKCDMCEATFTQKFSMTRHRRIHTGERPFRCDVCRATFSQRNILEVHKRRHTGEKPFSCDVCHMTFTQKGNLETHKRKHTGEKPFNCNVCEESFSKRSILETHKRKHAGENPFSCDVCPATFSHKNYLARHRMRHTGERPFKCDVCKATFTQKVSMTAHQIIHSGERPFQCDICEATFSRDRNLKSHKKIHLGDKPFKCEVCQASFAQKSDLTRHGRKHTGEKPFRCELCQATFSERFSLTVHRRKHTGERPYTCDVCLGTFSTNRLLKSHKRKHTGERPYACDMCQASFTQKCNLRKHKTVHTGERPFKCDICDAAFSRNYRLTAHKRRHVVRNMEKKSQGEISSE